MNKKFQAHLFLFLSNLIFGINLTIAKDVVPYYIKPYGVIVIRVSVSLILFFISFLVFTREKIMRKDILLMIACGFFGVAFNQLLFFKGLSITTPINTALIMTTTPILVFVISVFTKEDYVSWQRIAGIALGIAGAVTIILFGKQIALGEDRRLGDLCVFLNAVSYAIYIVIVKPLMGRYHPVTVITMVFFFGWFFVMPVGYSQFAQINWSTMPTTIIYELAFIVLGTTFLAYLFNILAMKSTSPSVVGIYIYLQPAIASSFALIMGKDVFSWEKIVATVLIFIGVYMVSFAGRKKVVSF